ncbi:MAG TPA: hypothetical protein VMX11_00200 [Actinomycetes bacterium]|nr:hypothetical protein [Actinomycetes bacterium]
MDLDKLDIAIATLTLAAGDLETYHAEEVRDFSAALHSLVQARQVLTQCQPAPDRSTFVDGVTLTWRRPDDHQSEATPVAEALDVVTSTDLAGFIQVMKSPSPEVDRAGIRPDDIEQAVRQEATLGTLRFTAEGAERIHAAARAIAEGLGGHQPKASAAVT